MTRWTICLLVLAGVWVAGQRAARGEVRALVADYTDGQATLEGYLVYDDAFQGKRPGVIVFHEWYGLNEYARARARQLAQMGYVALAADVYGKGRRATNATEAGKLAGEFKADRELMRRRAAAALRMLTGHPRVEPGKVAAIGYCFGGTVALELARGGADLAGVVSFHGGLDTPTPARPGAVKAKVLVLSGADDPHVPPEQVTAFWKEMKAAGADWQLNLYSGAVHAFTNPAAGDDPSRGAAYNEQADRRSWEAMQLFFRETIGLPEPPEESKVEAATEFTREKILKPVGKAGKATGKAVKKAFIWSWEKIKGDK